MIDPEQLIHGYLDDTLSAAEQDELHAWLIEDAAHMQRFTAALMLDQEIRRAVHAKEAVALADRFLTSSASRHTPSPSFPRPLKKSSPRLARAALWLGAFTWFGNKAQAATTATTLLMTKTTTTTIITASLLLVGGGTIYHLHEKSEDATARVQQLQERKQALLGITADNAAARQTSKSSLNSANNTAYLHRLNQAIRVEGEGGGYKLSMDPDVVKEMDEMDLMTLKELLSEAQKNGSDTFILVSILAGISQKSRAEFVSLTAYILTVTNEESLAVTALRNHFDMSFTDWLEEDQAAADQWYFSAIASGELIPKGIPKEGQERHIPERILTRARFQKLMESEPEQAAAMVTQMMPQDIVISLSAPRQDYEKVNTTPEYISRLVKKLPPGQQSIALQHYVDFLAGRDFTKAATWLDAVDIADSAQASLTSRAAQSAYQQKKLSQPEALQIIDSLPASPEREEARRVIGQN